MSISYIVSALIACGFTCVVGAFGMRVYFVRNREIADREDPRDTQIRDLQATLQVTRKDAVERKTTAEDATKHLEFAHDRINELLKSGKETTEKLDSCKELLRTKITEREQLHDKCVAAEREVNALKDRLEDVELELSMTNESGSMLDSGLESGTAQATGEHRAVGTNAEKTALQEKLASAQAELDAMSGKLATAEDEASTLRIELQDAQATPGVAGESQAITADERKELKEKLSATQDRVFVAEGKLAALQKESEEKLASAQEKLVAVEKDSRELLAAAQEKLVAVEKESRDEIAAALESVTAAESKLAAAHERASIAESKLNTATESASAAERKLVAAQDRISAAEGKLSAVEGRISAAEGKLSAAEKESEGRLAAAQEKLVSVEKLAEERIAAAKTRFLAAEKAAQDKLAAAEVRLSATEKVAEDKIAAAQEKIFTTETDANDQVSAAREEVESLKNQLTDFEQKLSEAVEADRVNAENQQNNVEDADSTDDGDEMYASSVEDGSPSLIQCLNEELDRWKRHCHVLGDELKQQREQFAEELAEQDADQQIIEEPTVNTVFAEPQFGEQSPDEAATDEPLSETAEEFSAEPDTAPEFPETRETEDQPVAEPEHTVWSAPGTSVDGNGGDAADADELTDIRGIGKVIAGKLHELGIYRYEQLASLDDDDFDRVHGLIPDFERRMRRDNWMEQARDLHSSKYSEQI